MNWVCYPLIGGLIGYATNCLAIRMVVKWLIPRRQNEIKGRILDEIIPKFLPAYIKALPPIKREFLRDTAEMMTNIEITKLADVFLSGSRELRFIKILGGIIGAVIGSVMLLLP